MHQVLKRIPRLSPLTWDVLFLLLAIALPYMSFMDRSRMSVAVLAGIFVMLGLSLNLIVGYAGLFQLGHAAFFGLGAYTAAILSIHHHTTMLATIPLAALIAGGVAILVTKPVLHLRGDYLCIVTIAFGEIFRIAVTNNIFGITGGANGLFGAGRPELPIPWLEPVPLILLAIFLVVYLSLTRKSGPALQWGGALLIAVGYLLPPLALDQKQMFLISLVMAFVALLTLVLLRDYHVGTRGQLAGLLVVVAVFTLIMAVRHEQLAADIDWNLKQYFKVETPVKVVGIKLTPVAFKRDARPYYFLVLAFIAVTVVGMRRLQNSRLGRAWLYVREDQLAAEAMGIDTTQVKLAAFAIGSAWAGVAGVLYASRFTVTAPESFNFVQSVIMFCIVVLGGSGSIPGVLVGTLGMVVLPELLRDVAPTFLYKGPDPLIMLAVILGLYLYSARQRWRSAAVEVGAVVAAFFLPPLLLNKPVLYALGIFMALVAVSFATWTGRRTSRALPWVLGALALYTVVIVVVGGALGPDLEREISKFRIMNWRDGLMGVAMVTMMVLRPAGIIPERRKGTVFSAVAQTTAPAVTAQQTV